MKQPVQNIRLPADPQRLAIQLQDLLSHTNQQLNQLSEGQIVATHNAQTSAPTTGTYAQGDKVWKTLPVEAGAGGSKYVILGWVCTVSGTPGTWLEMRTLTGN